ncbi:hypothetical protein ACFX16_009371 [Malus domestica]
MGYPMFQVCEKIKATRVALIKWQWDTVKARQLEIEKVRDQITTIDGQPYIASSIEEHSSLMHHFDSLLSLEESYWQQAKVTWMKSGG